MGVSISEKDTNQIDDASVYAKARQQVNTPDEIKLADKYIDIYATRKSELQKNYDEWTMLQDLYAAEDKDGETTEYGFVNVILPCIEGQVSAMTNQNVAATFRGKGYSDQKFARAAEVIFPSIFNENNIRQKLKKGIRRYGLFGNMILEVQWDADAWDGFGIPEYKALPLDSVMFDGKIKDMIDYQKGDYCIKEIPQSMEWVENTFDNGTELARAITLGNTDPSFDAELTGDDDKNFLLLEVWRKDPDNKNLQKIQMSRCGVILDISDPSEPYYKKVHNKYPFFIAGLYPKEGEFYCFGDGKLVKPVQTTITNLYHEVIVACKFSAQRRTFIDPHANVDPAEFDGDPGHPIYADNPNQFIYDQQGAGINAVVLTMIEHLLQQVEKMTRFSALMTGNNGNEKMTATQAGIMQTQGVSGIDDKKADISTAFGDATIYALGLCMELWPGGKAFRLTEGEDDEFEWVDIRELNNIPEMVPADEAYKKRFRSKNTNPEDMPKFMQLEYDEEETDAEGNPMFEMDDDGITPKLDETSFEPVRKMKRTAATKQVELDIDVSIGEGLPTNKMALYNIILTLSQLTLMDDRTQQPRSLLSYKQVKKMIEDYIGIKIEDYLDNPPEGQPPMPQQPQQQPINMDPNVPGANMNGQMGGGANVIA